MIIDDKIIALDNDGYLENIDEWNENIAIKIAECENIIMTIEHWNIIYLVRSFYLKYNISPTMRMLIAYINSQDQKSKSNSSYLFRLFPQGVLKQATRIAGIPKPSQCL
ncbi:sulfurtransferase TusE [Candidatus Pantoea edessiphila]|uniref:Sulfurtransferase n=1 Tax=Candidatus Pantoea edessiphila TaxID=2044610 RepID=A0A2P5SYW9_9GAMM|nr:TusE/DsrC/DsvC family sulfur relay protein [Candidatus Pantoea edessiphila]MBK4775341.1 TusE/DsrC/DsvC family sulfur relay protein [Pantoea sp. Edef]PPI87525.1 sulfurtransferase TusE [Candidatus Pantoea edessiphila]